MVTANVLFQRSLNSEDFFVSVPVELKKPTVTYTATYNEDKKLICEVSKGNPAPKVAWEYQVDTCNTKDCAALPDKWLSVEQVTKYSLLSPIWLLLELV